LITRIAGRWRFLDSGTADGVTNMAVDAALLDHARATGEATLRVYAWSRPTLSLGRHERARGRFSPELLRKAGVDVVRRPTGGRALLHDHEVTYSVTARTGDLALREAYAAVNALLTDALGRLGVRAGLAAPRGRTEQPGTSACFAEPNAGELVVGGAKLVASAQWQEHGAFLQHGSILLDDDQPRIAALTVGEPAPPTRAATLRALLGREIGYVEVRDALAQALRADVTSPPAAPSIPVGTEPGAEHRARFADPDWTWRR
jgi:lipoate-protein ligase A